MLNGAIRISGTFDCVIANPPFSLKEWGAEGRIREELIRQDMLEAVIGLGPNIFYGTQLAACVMVFQQNKEAGKKGKIVFIDASEQEEWEELKTSSNLTMSIRYSTGINPSPMWRITLRWPQLMS